MRVKKKDQEPITKRPWKANEEEKLLSHVSKYGPRDWSSIQSKGFLQRTGKSCRLFWVNKLRPNLKKCKFSLDEERVVIEMQAQFGNRWAKIASYLPRRIDNDVKNFWSIALRKGFEQSMSYQNIRKVTDFSGVNEDVHFC